MKLNILTISVVLGCALTSISSHAGTPNFSGYGRYASEASDDTIIAIKADHASVNGPGRLGNEGNWMEWMLSQGFEMEKAKFDINVMIDTPGYTTETTGYLDGNGGVVINEGWRNADIKIAQFYGGGKGIFESQPEAYVWAGKRFNGREQTDINDYFMMSADGGGAGIDNLDFGWAKFDTSWVQGGNGAGSANQNDGNISAFLMHLHDIKVGESGKLKFRATYAGLSGNIADNRDIENDKAMQLYTAYHHGFSNGWLQLSARYETDALALSGANAAGWEVGPNADHDAAGYMLFLNGSVDFNDMMAMQYASSYLYIDCKDDEGCGWQSFDDRTEYSATVRPQISWNDYMATALEVGYQYAELDNSDNDSNAWKVTLSQNFQLGHFMWSRPVVRFYAVTGSVDHIDNSSTDVTKFGAMVEAWW
ncbi:carbohydrate porin [Psychromonas sp. MME2]|uniref:carbohydrate porin n=1 Tax=unclassified Psychromonas TaxID=2614957 RepID=UPI00339CC15A